MPASAYARELVRVAEEYTVPLTWLIYVSASSPIANMNLYRDEYLHPHSGMA